MDSQCCFKILLRLLITDFPIPLSSFFHTLFFPLLKLPLISFPPHLELLSMLLISTKKIIIFFLLHSNSNPCQDNIHQTPIAIINYLLPTTSFKPSSSFAYNLIVFHASFLMPYIVILNTPARIILLNISQIMSSA